jgi:hypothetical protein
LRMEFREKSLQRSHLSVRFWTLRASKSQNSL